MYFYLNELKTYFDDLRDNFEDLFILNMYYMQKYIL